MNTEQPTGLEKRRTAPGAVGAHAPARSLAGATTLQIMPALNDEPAVRAALHISGSLLRAGARSLIASSGGPLVSEFHAQGGEWIPFHNAHVNRWNLGRAANALEEIITAERVDIIHALSTGGAATAHSVRERLPVRMITSLPDGLVKRTWFDNRNFEALARGERIIVHSAFMAAPMIKQYDMPHERIVVIPHSIDTTKLDPATVRSEQTAGIRNAWRVRTGERVFLAPGRVGPGSGHITFVDAVRVLVNGGLRGAVFVIPRDNESDPKHVRSVAERAAAQGVDGLFRFSNPPTDMPTLQCAADVIVVPVIEPPTDGRIVAEAQALARPVIASGNGVLPENLLAPPRTTSELRTGWLVRPEDPVSLARAIGAALSLEEAVLRAHGVRARHFAEATFSPQSVAAATLAVYTSVLGGGRTEGDGGRGGKQTAHRA
jgi:glycosyltransferase involved in cell wall biosynthesis